MKKLYLVDVSSFFFRAFFAIPPMKNKNGLPTNALYGFLTMVVKLLKQLKPDYVVFCQDRKEPSFRVDLYSEYKANRNEMPEDLVPQMPYIQKLIDVLGVTSISKEGYEADDVIGSLAKFGRDNQLEVVIVSGDKDFAQLIRPFVSMYDTMKEVTYDADKVQEKWGVSPEQFKDYLALTGDASDNIPGIKGVGPKTAQKLLAEYSDLEGIFKNKDKISGKALKSKIEQGEKEAYLSKELVTIVENLDFGVELEDLKLKDIDRDHLLQILDELDFKSLVNKLLNGMNGSASSSKTESKKTSPTEINAKSEVAISHNFKSKDFESIKWGEDEIKANIKPYSEVYGIYNERGLILGVDNKAVEVTGDLDRIGDILNSKIISWKGFDLKEFWKALNLKDPIALWDSKIAAYVCKAGAIKGFAEVYTEYTGKMYPEIPTSGQILNCEIELEEMLLGKLKTLNGLKVYQEIELKVIPVLYAMEQIGICLDSGILEAQSKELGKDIKIIEQRIYELAGVTFNIASPKQLAKILFEDMKIPPGKKTKTGYSTNSDVLEKLKQEYVICDEVLKYRELSKLKSTYVDSLPLLADKDTGRIHTHFNQALTSTGRLSSINPNLQNIPIRTERGKDIRRAFYADEGNCLISIDYSQIELRVLASIAKDKGLLNAFKHDKDVHTATAMEVFGVKEEEVNAELRRKAKAVNFGIAYGQGVFGLSENLGISRKESKEIIDNYFKKFQGVKRYMDETVARAVEYGYVETLFGRRRYIEELKSKSAAVRKFGERAAINAPIQGTASDIVKIAMVKVFEELSYPILLQVHDEILVECPEGHVEEAIADITEIMENAVKLEVPLKVNVAVGKNWREAHA